MNFIDRAFENNLHGDDFLQAMAGIYSEYEVTSILDNEVYMLEQPKKL